MREISYTVPAEFDGVQAQVFLKSRGISRRVLTALKRSGGLTRGGGILRTVDAVHAGEVITLQLDGGETSVAANPELSADIVYEDEDVVVFNKPPFMPVHPSQRHHDDTLANLFAARYPGLPFRPINRLDRNTSGLCVCAKNQFAAAALSGSISKVYYAITDGTPPGDTVDAPIGRLGDSVIERCVTPDGKPAVTHFRKIAGERVPGAGGFPERGAQRFLGRVRHSDGAGPHPAGRGAGKAHLRKGGFPGGRSCNHRKNVICTAEKRKGNTAQRLCVYCAVRFFVRLYNEDDARLSPC